MIPPAAAEVLWSVGSFPITNALVNGWIAVAFFVLLGLLLRRRASVVPRGLQNAVEALVEFFMKEVEKVAGDAQKARKFLPLVGSIFLFILFSNWLGLMPGTGTIGVWGLHHGEVALLPLLRPAASDLNLTLAIAAFAILFTHLMGMRLLGSTNHLSKFINVRGIWRALRKGPMAVAVACIEFAIGLLEIVGEFAKILSLSLRLFGNIFAGEVLITVMLGLFAYVLPIPFMFLELLVGAVQATVFALLTLAYLSVASSGHGDEEHEGSNGSHGAKDSKDHQPVHPLTPLSPVNHA